MILLELFWSFCKIGFTSFGGLSILMQNLLFLGKSIRPGRLLACRLLHGAAAYGICGLLVRLFPSFL